MTTPKPKPYILQLECAGEHFSLERSLLLAQHVERHFGPISPLHDKLRRVEFSVDELSVIFRRVLEFEEGAAAPTRDEIRDWLFATGVHTPSKALAAELLTLIMGNEQLAQWHQVVEQQEKDARAAALVIRSAAAAVVAPSANAPAARESPAPASDSAGRRLPDGAAQLGGQEQAPAVQQPPPATQTEQRAGASGRGAWVPPRARARQPAEGE